MNRRTYCNVLAVVIHVFYIDVFIKIIQSLKKAGVNNPEDVAELAALLEAENGRAYTQTQADELTEQALSALDEAQPQGDAGEALAVLARRLLRRDA